MMHISADVSQQLSEVTTTTITTATTTASTTIISGNCNSVTGSTQFRKSGSSDMRSSDTILLHPLDHQVGGHTQLMLLDQTTVCKPLIQRELLFYLNIPRELRPFVPVYKG